MKSLVLAVVAALALTACSQLEGDVAISEQIDGDDDRGDMVRGFMEGTSNAFLVSEAECVIDNILESDVTPDELLAMADQPEVAFGFYSIAVPECVDLSASVESSPVEGPIREGMLDGFEASGLTPSEGECLLDALVDGGYDTRDLVIAGYMPDAFPEFGSDIAAAAPGCLGS